MKSRKLPFWLAVGGVSLIASFSARLVADRFPQAGLSQFVEYTFGGRKGN